jgi:hypothetical protein
MKKISSKMKTTTIDPNRIRVRDPLMLRLINGATKSGAHKTREPEELPWTCRQCSHEYAGKDAGDGFCSDTCMKQYDAELTNQGEDDGTT